MIIVHLLGGLGNQMFQYAVGKALSLKRNEKLVLDLSSYKYDKLRSYNLDCFQLQVPFLNPFERLIYLKVAHKFNSLTIYKDKDLLYNPRLFQDTSKNISLHGYWQSEKYFKAYETDIRKYFTFKHKYSEEILNKIRNSNSVSLHVRRGDYISNQKTNSVHGVCSLDYYRKAIKYFTERVKNSVYFVFSDDIDWVKTNITLTNETFYLDDKNRKDWEDLQLMSTCKHHIIANSTFSWWGAWLNPNNDKIVVAPKKWFRDSSANTTDLIPAEWIRI